VVGSALKPTPFRPANAFYLFPPDFLMVWLLLTKFFAALSLLKFFVHVSCFSPGGLTTFPLVPPALSGKIPTFFQ